MHLGKSELSKVSGFDGIFPNIKKLRDALAHLDERVEESILVPKTGKVPVAWDSKAGSF
jgi:hypothetical protein